MSLDGQKTEDRSMPGSVFKIVVDSGDWGGPMTNEATFLTASRRPKPKREPTSSDRD